MTGDDEDIDSPVCEPEAAAIEDPDLSRYPLDMAHRYSGEDENIKNIYLIETLTSEMLNLDNAFKLKNTDEQLLS